jgi:hypothetical protein
MIANQPYIVIFISFGQMLYDLDRYALYPAQPRVGPREHDHVAHVEIDYFISAHQPPLPACACGSGPAHGGGVLVTVGDRMIDSYLWEIIPQ